jgi:Domain of unknown function (DUF4271)
MFFFSVSLCAQSADSIIVQNDSLQIEPIAGFSDSVKLTFSKRPVFELKNKLLNSNAEPVSFVIQFKNAKSGDTLFYVIAGLLLLLGFLKYFYNRYFTNLFRVFFNTSLRQSQLTDQLLQAKLASLLFNLFFVISAGLYVYIILSYFKLLNVNNKWILIFSSIAIMGLIYFIKFCTLKFTGWITGLREITDTYIFVIFLINKIIGIFLVPFIIIQSFSDISIVRIAVLISLMSIGIFLILRFYRSYGLIQSQLKISRFHFFLYIIGVEILPLLLIYKGLMGYLSKNL